MTTERTVQGDVLDALCVKVYGPGGEAAVVTVLNANPRLADLGPVLPSGLTITFPEWELTSAVGQISLWEKEDVYV
jgi:phage tail protein X